MVNVKEMAAVIGKEGMLQSEGMEFRVVVRDARRVWDRTDYLVGPIGGTGTKWVGASRVEFPTGVALVVS